MPGCGAKGLAVVAIKWRGRARERASFEAGPLRHWPLLRPDDRYSGKGSGAELEDHLDAAPARLVRPDRDRQARNPICRPRRARF